MLTAIDFDTLEIAQYGLIIGFLAVSLGLHEMMHAWVAYLCGDSTGKDLGRMTPDPRPHIDPFMTVLLPAILLIASGGRMFFAGAKPVPVTYHRLRSPARDMMLVAIAGPLTNFVIAIVLELARKALLSFGVFGPGQLGDVVLTYVVFFNVLLAVFNMLPLPPLDGSRVVAFFLPPSLREAFHRLESIGMLLIFGLLFTGVFGRFVVPAIYQVYSVVDYLTGGPWA